MSKIPFDEIDISISFDFEIEIFSNRSNSLRQRENKFSFIECFDFLKPGRSGINVQTSPIHFLRDSLSIRPH